MRSLLLIAALAPLPAKAADLWCTIDRACVPGTCHAPESDESSLRLTNPKSLAPSLLSHGETVAMTKTFEHLGYAIWQGKNARGETEILELDQDRTRFVYSIGGEFVKSVGRELRFRANGSCEAR